MTTIQDQLFFDEADTQPSYQAAWDILDQNARLFTSTIIMKGPQEFVPVVIFRNLTDYNNLRGRFRKLGIFSVTAA